MKFRKIFYFVPEFKQASIKTEKSMFKLLQLSSCSSKINLLAKRPGISKRSSLPDSDNPPLTIKRSLQFFFTIRHSQAKRESYSCKINFPCKNPLEFQNVSSLCDSNNPFVFLSDILFNFSITHYPRPKKGESQPLNKPSWN